MENINLTENKKSRKNFWDVINKFNTIIDTFRNIMFFILFIFMLILIIIIIIAYIKLRSIFNIIENDVISVIKTLELNITDMLKDIENLPNTIKNGVTSIF